MLIYTIGDYFAQNRKDVHFIQFKNATEDNCEELSVIERWEDGNDASVDPRFQCYFLPLEDYIKWFGEDILNFDYDMI